ncbi:RnfABCDGE type electron transport complex subunit D [Paenibacillus sp. 453mf]|uniref:RnfABCDGE type electron transport complex subunit D n=1 Tax=Paenibacillus sp. 453mf TaxID=1761874 RepID=UPI0008E9D1A6|nr:RnfABCDGE type electron transport complex subunit D [Paenibacillus sp. 453mf]SFS54450.1 NQR2, RnfD, RnfE family [Paenibacillus sp. 453mf]
MKILNDPRYFILLFLLSFTMAGQLLLGFFQDWTDVLASVVTAVVLELIIVGFRYKTWKSPLSALITGLGIGLLLSSHLTWPYILTSVLAIGIKHALRIDRNHIFNPNNVAMVIMLFFLPQYAVSTPKQWTNGWEIMFIILFFGFLAAYKAGRMDTVLAFASGYALFAGIRHWGLGEPFYYAFGPMLGAAFQLFTFFMITDPKTTPSGRNQRIWFGFAIALSDAILRVAEVNHSLFYASFLVTLLIGLPLRIWKVMNNSRQAE